MDAGGLQHETRALRGCDPIPSFFERVVAEGVGEGLIGEVRFRVDGSLIHTPAGHTSVKPIDEDRDDDDDDDLNGWLNFKGTRRSNAMHRSVVDPEARLASRGGEAPLSRSLHALTDARSGLFVRVAIDAADGRAERRCALLMLDRVKKRHGLRPGTLASGAGYGAGAFLREVEERGITLPAATPRW